VIHTNCKAVQDLRHIRLVIPKNLTGFSAYFFKNALNKSIAAAGTSSCCVRCHFAHGLEIAQLQRNRFPGDQGSGLHIFSRLGIAFCVQNLRATFAFGLGCLAIARFMLSGSATSSLDGGDLMPHGSVCRSMISCNFWLMMSRCESRSSNGDCPARCAASSAR